MEKYNDEEKLNLSNMVYITKDVRRLIDKERSRLKKTGRKVSRAKIVCNLIIENFKY